MSRIGKRILKIPSGVSCEMTNQRLVIKGGKGSLERTIHSAIKVVITNEEVKLVNSKPANRQAKASFGTENAHIANMLTGVTTGFTKNLELVGVGYRGAVKGDLLELQLGYSHPVEVKIPTDLQITMPKPRLVTINGIDKELVGQFAALVRSWRPPEPYKGKGVLYAGEKIIRKQGKTGKSGK